MFRRVRAACVLAALCALALLSIFQASFAPFPRTAMAYSVSSPAHVHWAHAVNSQAKLADALANLLAIEADVLLASSGIAVMAHPPATDSDLSLDDFLSRVASAACIVKLDFKSHAAFHAAEARLRAAPSTLRARIWLNADILQGSNAAVPSFDAASFIAEASACRVAKLSVGWTTSAASIEYSDTMIDEMLSLLAGKEGMTLPIKATLVRANWDALKRVYTNSSHGMTLWSNEAMSDDELTWLYTTLEMDPSLQGRTFYDLPGWTALVARMGW
ncbi:hypothetical protein ACHHYP_15737 [Achlya hypogyna]|uniref:Menorin-like domain-containing protein n=1 Tax=Achlya hypogyna TaxID=1202772 RepID=A0A1V9YA62_ACHHY|nr:hypothetical protein ACHHYP_15737 [Achlya hypogyna]